MKRILLFIILILSIPISLVKADLLLVENFEYDAGQNLTSNGWTAFSSGGTNPITVASGSLTFPDYISSGIGNSALLDNNGEDDRKSFTQVSSNIIYASALVKISTAYAGYFFHFRSGSTNIGRLFVKSGSDYYFGLTKNDNTGNYTSSKYNYDQTYLIVLKYEFKPGENDDEVSLYVFNSGADHSSEPVTPTLGPCTDGSDVSDIDNIALRQFNSGQNITVDGIRIATTWSEATLPVTLSTFTAQYLNNIPTLYWVTQSETDNIGWYIYRNNINSFSTSEKVSGIIGGYGTTTEPHSYIYEDQIEYVSPGDTYWYWLESIDFGGTINHYDKVAYIVIPENNDPGNTNPEETDEFGLFQNYPNPFNPKIEESTEISFNLKEQVYVDISIYNIKGELIKNIYNDYKSDGFAVWDGKDKKGNIQATGIYLYELKVNNKIYSTKRILLIR